MWIKFVGQHVDRIEKKRSAKFPYFFVTGGDLDEYWLSNNCTHFGNAVGVKCFAGFNVKPHYENGELGMMFYNILLSNVTVRKIKYKKKIVEP